MGKILALDITGSPFRWLSYEQAIYRVAANKIAWSIGDENSLCFHGGVQRISGLQSVIYVPPIIALVKSEGMAKHLGDIALSSTNEILFARDNYTCSYCGKTSKKLTRDHIIPTSRGGKDTWLNCTTACQSCNQFKGNRTLDECSMQLLWTPYIPNRFENFILSGRNILDDQMQYLQSRVAKNSRILERNFEFS